MAKLHFYYGGMNSGKSTTLLQSARNYEEQDMHVLAFKPRIDTREGSEAFIRSRIGLSMPALLFTAHDNLEHMVEQYVKDNQRISAVFVDEAQFLTPTQVMQLCELVDFRGVPVLAYGLRTDFQGQLFPGSAILLAQAEMLVEIKGICRCGKKSTHVVRLDDNGQPEFSGEQIVVGGNDRYLAVCRRCHAAALRQYVLRLRTKIEVETHGSENTPAQADGPQ
jgi:thymidine kinase